MCIRDRPGSTCEGVAGAPGSPHLTLEVLSIMMEEQKQSKGCPPDVYSGEERVQSEIARKNFVRAAIVAETLQRPQAEVRHLQELALKQMACKYRNAIGTRKLAQRWAFSRADVEDLLATALEEHEARTDKTGSDRCYDTATGKYLTLREWIGQFLSTGKRRGG